LDVLDDMSKTQRYKKLNVIRIKLMKQDEINKKEIYEIIQTQMKDVKFTSDDLLKILGIDKNDLSNRQMKIYTPLRTLVQEGCIEVDQSGLMKVYRIKDQLGSVKVLKRREDIIDVPKCRDCGGPPIIRKDGISLGRCKSCQREMISKRNLGRGGSGYKVVLDFANQRGIFDAITAEAYRDLRTIENQIIYFLRARVDAKPGGESDGK